MKKTFLLCFTLSFAASEFAESAVPEATESRSKTQAGAGNKPGTKAKAKKAAVTEPKPAPVSAAVTELMPLTITASRLRAPVTETPRSMSVVTRKQIERQSPQVMTDLLRGQPGVFNQSSGPGQGIAIIRGLKGSEVLHLVDGMRLNMAFFRNSPSQYIALVDPYSIQQIEVLRGPAATLYGSDAMGGVVQVLTPEQRFSGREFSARGGLLAQFDSSNHGNVQRGWAAVGNEEFSASLGLTNRGYGSQDIGAAGGVDFTGYDARSGDIKLLWAPAPGHELMLNAQYFEAPKLPRYFEIAGGPGGAGTGAAMPVFFEPNDRQFVHGRYRLNLANGDSYEMHLASQIINDDRSRLIAPGGVPTEETEKNQSNLTGLTLQANTRLGPVGLIYGFEYYNDEVNSSRQRRNLNTGAITRQNPTFPDGSATDSLGTYVNAEWRALEPWLLMGGLRYSHVTTDLQATAVSVAAKVIDQDVTVHAGSLYGLTPQLGWTLNVARGFRAPNLFDLGTLGQRPNSNQFNVPNPNLSSETITTIDTGFKWDGEVAGHDLRAETSVFYSIYDDRIEPREATGNLIPAGTLGCVPIAPAVNCTEVQSRNITSATFWGFEAGAHYYFSRALETYATLNYTFGEENKANRSPSTTPANRVPPLNGQIGVLYEPGPWLVESFILGAFQQRRLDDDDLTDTRISRQGTQGWVTWNARLGWTPTPMFRFRLDLKNILDQSYREHGSGIDGQGFGTVLTAEARFR